jgi:ABC-type lipoprotein release transport system permease subunit
MRQALVVFKRSMVQLGFMIEFSIIAVMGIVIGLSLGVILAYLLLQSPELSGSAAAFSPVVATSVIQR